MKTIINSILIMSVVMGSTAFTIADKEKKVVTESTINWKGKKILGSHTGTVTLTEGYLEMDGDQLVGGKFVVDMTSITVTDLKDKNKAKLEGHLKSDDFFGVENHPTSTLVIKKATKVGTTYEVSANMTIKGITNPLNFVLEMGQTGARASVVIDRMQYNVQFGSGSISDKLADNAISDNFELDVMMKF